MKHSSRNAPCPICNRNSDDKCRWTDEMIFCYDGNSFSPPQFLKIGDRVKVGTESYALFSVDCGFANNSYGFAKSDEFDYRFLTHEDKKSFRKKCVGITRTFLEKQKIVNTLLSSIKDENTFHEMNVNSFYLNKSVASTAIADLKLLIEFAVANKRHIVDYLTQIKKANEASDATSLALEQIRVFENLHFHQ